MFSNGVYAEPLTAQFSYTSLAVDNTHGSPGTSYGRAMYFSAMCKLWKNDAGCPCSAVGFLVGCVSSGVFCLDRYLELRIKKQSL